MTDLITTEMFYSIVIESQVYANKYDAQNVADSLNSQINEKIQPLIEALEQIHNGTKGESRSLDTFDIRRIAQAALEKYRSEK